MKKVSSSLLGWIQTLQADFHRNTQKLMKRKKIIFKTLLFHLKLLLNGRLTEVSVRPSTFLMTFTRLTGCVWTSGSPHRPSQSQWTQTLVLGLQHTVILSVLRFAAFQIIFLVERFYVFGHSVV